MVCPKCKANLNDNSEYCPKCGFYFSNNNKNIDLLSDSFLKSQNKVSPSNISVCYLLFGGIYAIYKKLYYIALNTFLIDFFSFSLSFGLFNFLIKEKSLLYKIIQPSLLFFDIIVHIYYIFNFNKELFENRNIRDNKIKRDNSDVDNDTLSNLLEKDRKNNLFGMLISIIILFIYFYICFISKY